MLRAEDLRVEDIRQAMADYVAGDLTQREAQEFEQLLNDELGDASEPQYARDQAFWDAMFPALTEHGRPLAQLAKGDLAQRIHEHLQAEIAAGQRSPEQSLGQSPVSRSSSSPTISFPSWMRYVVTAAAASILTIIAFSAGQSQGMQSYGNAAATTGLPSQSSPSDTAQAVQAQEADYTVAFNEHGAAVAVPRTGEVVTEASYLPYHDVRRVSLDNTKLATHAAVIRPYVGFLIQPIRVDGSAEHSTGALVLQVTDESPAAKAGISPGDIMLLMAACPMKSRYCVPHALDGKKPGDVISVKYWKRSTNIVVATSLTLGASNE